MAATVTFEDDSSDVTVTTETTGYGAIPVIDCVVDTFVLEDGDWETLFEKYNGFEQGMTPNFFSQLSTILNVGEASGTPADQQESSPSEVDPEGGPQTS